MDIKIMSFNTQHCKNFITKKIDYKPIINLINKNNIDIIGLNEVYFYQTKIIADKLGYYCHFTRSTHILPYGNALITKYPIINVKKIKIKKTNEFEKRSILKASILINDKILNVLVTHLGLNADNQKKGIDTLVKNTDKLRTIIIGDFNVDNNLILKPLSSDFIKDNTSYTWPSNNPKRKIDYIFISKDIKKIEEKTVNTIISDHLPIISKIEI